MKTQLITLFTALVLSSGIAAKSYATPTKQENVTVLNDVSAIKKIEVRGNVELYISNGITDQVKVYNKYYAENALVQSKNGVLTIASYKTEKLVVWVTAADLRFVSAYDNAEIRSFGDLSGIELIVDLHNNASARLALDAYSANITVTDQAKATLSGKVNTFNLKYNRGENIMSANLETVNASKVQTGPEIIAKVNNDEFADL